jgi:hypothetical protein
VDRKKWLKSPAGITAIVALLIAGYMAYLFATRGSLTYHGWPHPMALATVGCAITAVGLWLKKEWSRWLGIAVVVVVTAMAFIVGWPEVFSWTSLGQLAGAVICCWHLWQLPITRVQEIVSDPVLVAEIRRRAEKLKPRLRALPKWEVILLERVPDRLGAAALAESASRAFGHTFRILDKEISPLDAAFLPTEHDEPIVAGKLPILLCVEPPHLLGVFSFPGSYISEWAGGGLFEQARLDDLVLPPHNAFVAIAMLPSVNQMDAVENGSRWTCRLAQALMGASTVAVILPDERKVVADSPGVRSALLAGNPYAAIEALGET